MVVSGGGDCGGGYSPACVVATRVVVVVDGGEGRGL